MRMQGERAAGPGRFVVVIDVGTSEGGSAKLLVLDRQGGAPVPFERASPGYDAFCAAIRRTPPDVFFSHVLRKAAGMLPEGATMADVARVVMGFPAFVSEGRAPYVENLWYEEGRQRRRWTDVDLAACVRRAAGRPELDVLVVNDLVLGVVGFLDANGAELRSAGKFEYLMAGGGLGRATVVPLFAGVGEPGWLVLAGETGHDEGFEPDAQGGTQRAKLEALVSSNGAKAAFQAAAKRDAADFRALLDEARAKDRHAQAALDRIVLGMAQVAAASAHALCTTLYLVGPVANALDAFFRETTATPLAAHVRATAARLSLGRSDLQEPARFAIEVREARDNTAGGAAIERLRAVDERSGVYFLPAGPHV